MSRATTLAITALALTAVLILSGCGSNSSSAGSAIFGRSGGTITISGFIVWFPVDALAGETQINVTPLSTATLPKAPPAGKSLLSAVSLDASVSAFAGDVYITFPLATAQTVGDELTLYLYDSAAWHTTAIGATVLTGGLRAQAKVQMPGTYALFTP